MVGQLLASPKWGQVTTVGRREVQVPAEYAGYDPAKLQQVGAGAVLKSICSDAFLVQCLRPGARLWPAAFPCGGRVLLLRCPGAYAAKGSRCKGSLPVASQFRPVIWSFQRTPSFQVVVDMDIMKEEGGSKGACAPLNLPFPSCSSKPGSFYSQCPPSRWW